MGDSVAMRRKAVEAWAPDEPIGTYDVHHVQSADGDRGNVLHFRCAANRHCLIAEAPLVSPIAPGVAFTVHLGLKGVTVVPVVACQQCGWRGYIIQNRMAGVSDDG